MRPYLARSLALSLLLVTSACGRDVLFPTFFSSEGRLEIVPAALELNKGQTFEIDVVQRTETGTVSILGRAGLLIRSSDEAVVKVGADGRGEALAGGTASIKAELGGQAAVAGVTVSEAALVSIRVEPTELRLAIGDEAQLTVTGQLDDGTSADLTSEGTSYGVEAAQVLSVSAEGRVQALAIGDTTITVTNGGFEARVSVKVESEVPEFVALRVAPETVALELGAAGTFEVFAVRGDGTEEKLDASDGVIAMSADPSVAQVVTFGVVEARAPGATIVLLQFGELQGAFEVAVRPPEVLLTSITAEPRFTELPVGGTVQLQVLGFYSDGSVAELTLGATGTQYDSADPMGASVDGDGLITALRANAMVPIRISHGMFFAEVFIQVLPDDVRVVDLIIEPQQPRLQVMGVLQMVVIAVFSDGSQRDVTRNGAIFEIVRGLGVIELLPDALVIGLSPGDAEIRIEYGGIERFLRVEVIRGDPELLSLEINPNPIQVDAGQVTRFTLTGFYDDGTAVDLTFDPRVTFTVVDPGVAQHLGGGELVGLGAGRTVLIAEFDNFGARVEVIVQQGPRQLLGIQVFAPTMLGVGQTEGIQVFAAFSDMTFDEITFDPNLRLTLSRMGIVTIGMGGVTGLAAGSVEVTGEFMGFVSSVTITVTPQVDPIIDIVFVPPQVVLQLGQTQLVNLIATHASGMRSDVTFDSRVMYNLTAPADLLPTPMGIEVRGTAPIFAEFFAELAGLNAVLRIEVRAAPPMLDRIEIAVPGTIAALHR